MMKYLLYVLSGIMITFLLCIQFGCKKSGSFLDKKVTVTLNESTVFSDSTRTMDFLAGTYESLSTLLFIQAYLAKLGPLSESTDESSTRWPGGHNITNQIITGTFGTPFYDYEVGPLWSLLYSYIRQCNIYLKDVKPEHTPFSSALTKRTRAETRFLRAYNYFFLLKVWGGVPLVGDTVFSLEAPNNLLRSSVADCVSYIVSELDAIAPLLPLKYTGIDYGRITRGACLALKARVLLFAASPLFNGGSIATDPKLVNLTAYPKNDASRWQKALKAAQAVVNLGIYNLVVDNSTESGYGFYEVFTERVNPEYILARMYGPNNDVEYHLLPGSRGGRYLRYPTQELVDAFPMKNGLPVTDPNSGYDPDNPYINRDPRFYNTIIYNGALWFNSQTHQTSPIWTYKGAHQDGIKPVTSNTGTNTGYYVCKTMDRSVTGNGAARTDRCIPLITYDEILLDVAEAANETGNTPLAMQQLITLRKRAGIEPGPDDRYGLPANPTEDSARKLIHNARFIELAFEGHRFWDLRRWKDGPMLDGKYMHGMEITKQGSSFSYKRVTTRKRYFKPNLYLFPIPHKAIELNRNILQNPGW